MKKEKGILKMVLTPPRDLVNDVENPNDIDMSKFINRIFNESLVDELEKHGRRISKVKNPYKLILEVKTAKK